MHRILLGYDLRHRIEAYAEERWDSLARDTYLLRNDVAWPKSVDRLVWPSLFRYPGHIPADLSPVFAGRIAVTASSIQQTAIWLWHDYEAMMAAAAGELPTARAAVPIAVTVIARAKTVEECPWDLFRSSPARPAPGVQWLVIGFDVADAGFISGLMNCGYRVEEKELLSDSWRPHINAHGLLESHARADGFREITDRRVPQHAPFYVFEIAVPGEASL